MATQYPFQCKSCGFHLYTDHEGTDATNGGCSYLYTCDKCNSFVEKTIDKYGKKLLYWIDAISNKTLYDSIFDDFFEIESEKGEELFITKSKLANDEECPVCKNTGSLKRWNPIKYKCPKCKNGEMIQLPGIMFTD